VGASTASPLLPPTADSRLDVYRNLLTNFMWSLGSGLKARKRGDPNAGLGEALLGPWELEARRLKEMREEQEIKLRLAQENRTQAAAQEAMSRIKERDDMLPARIREILAQAGVNEARVPQIQAQTVTEQARPGQIQAQTRVDQARVPLIEAQVQTEQQRPDLIEAQTAVANRNAMAPYPLDPWGEEAIAAKIKIAEANARNNGGRSTLYERLGHDGYMKKLKEEAQIRAGISEGSVEAYVQGVAQGNVSNLSQIPQVVRAEVLAKVGNLMIISPTDKDIIRKMDTATYLVDRLEYYSQLVSEDPTDIEAVSTLSGLRQAVAGVFAKGVFAEAGVLTEGDIKRVNSIVPGITKSILAPDIAKTQFNELRGIINKAKQNLRRPIGQVSGQAQPVVTTPPPTTPAAPGVEFVIRGGRVTPAGGK